MLATEAALLLKNEKILTIGCFKAGLSRCKTLAASDAGLVRAVRTIQGLSAGFQKTDGLPGEIEMGVDHDTIGVVELMRLGCAFPQPEPCMLQCWRISGHGCLSTAAIRFIAKSHLLIFPLKTQQ